MITKSIRKLFKPVAILVMATLLVFGGPSIYAFDIPTPPSAPTPPPQPTAPPAPTNDEPAPTPPPAPSWNDPEPTPAQGQQQDEEGGESNQTQEENSSSNTESQSEESPAGDLSGVVDNGNTGDTTIETGDATNAATITNDINSNLSATPGSGESGGATIVNEGNGSGSDNSGSVAIINDNNTFQDNSATVINNLEQLSNSGENSASRNVGNSTVETGNANTTGTIVNAVNTNVDGVAVAEFNVVDDQVGDIILDFGTGCLIGCTPGDLSVENSGNGSDSTNSGDITSITNNATFQTNDATVENNMTLAANSGTNYTDSNTGGNSSIETGDANVSANALTFANNNIEGNVLYAVVNIFGNLVGDILLPDLSVLSSCCGFNGSVTNSGNGSGSENSGSIDQSTNDMAYQFNSVELENNLILDANSGGNSVSGNTGGTSSVETGDTSIDAQVLNVANMNLAGGNWWLVLVNEAGQWIGRIVGGDEGANWAGSTDFEFLVNEFGEITVVNSGNGADSVNSGSVNSETNNTLVQTNTANIVNNLNLSANSGNNSASRNTGGNSSITTGDANIIANIVNFVNNNISGGGKLLVTVVNVFGSWLGDFVGPGQEKQNSNPGIGGVGSQSGESQVTSSQGAGGSSAQSGSSPAGQPPARRALASLTGVLGLNSGTNGNQIASVSVPVPGGVAGDKKSVNINLAWILASLFPIGVVTTAIRRRKAIVKVLTFFL